MRGKIEYQANATSPSQKRYLQELKDPAALMVTEFQRVGSGSHSMIGRVAQKLAVGDAIARHRQ